MEFMYPNLDEFILDFDAEEAALQLQAQVLGQMQAFAAAGPGPGVFPVRQAQTLPNTALRTRGRQQLQLGGGGVPTAEPVHLDSQLDALRREIARLEQQKQKQASARSAATGTAAASNRGVRRAQQQVGVDATGLPKPTGTANAGAITPPGVTTQRQLVTKRPRIAGPAQSDAAPAGGAAADAPQAAGATGTIAAASQGPHDPAVSEVAPASTGQFPDATGAAAPSGQLQRVGSKRPANGAVGGPAPERRAQVAKRQPPQRKPPKLQQLSIDAQPPEAREPGSDAADARQTQPGGGQRAEASPQRAPQIGTTAHADLPSFNDTAAGVKGSGKVPALRSAAGRPPGQLQAPGASSAQGSQQSPSHAGPGPPWKRPRALGQQPAASTSTSGRTAAIGGSSGPHLLAATTRHAVAGAHTASNSSASTQDGSPAAVLGQSKPVRPELEGPGALQARLTGADEAAVGSGDEELGASDPCETMEPANANGRPAASDSGAAQISPEAEQAATAFLRSFMTQISGERGESGDQAAAAVAVQEQHGHDTDAVTDAAAAAVQQLVVQSETAGGLQPPHNVQQPQQQRQRHPLVHSNPHGEPAAPGHAAELTCSVGLGRPGSFGNGANPGAEPLAVDTRVAPSPGAGVGGALARRAAAERTSAAVQRLRRRLSGVAGTDSLHRPAALEGAVAAAAPVNSSDSASGAAIAGGAAGAGPRASATAVPPPADGAPGVEGWLPVADERRRQLERSSGGGALLHHTGPSGQLAAVGSHPQQPSVASAGVVANVEGDTPAASAVGMRASGRAGWSPGRPAAAAAFHASGTGVAAEAAAAAGEAHEALGAVASPAAVQPLSHVEGEPEATGTAGVVRSLDCNSQAGAAALHMPALVHAHARGRGFAHDRARPGPGLPVGEALPHRSPPLISPPHDRPGFGVPGLLLSGTAGLAPSRVPNLASLHASTLAPGALPGHEPAGVTAGGAPQTDASPHQQHQQPPTNALHPPGPSCPPFRPGAPLGVGPPVGLPHLPFPHPPLGLPPHVLLGGHGPGPFPGAFPPGLQWRPGPPSSVPGVPGQPVVSLVEIEVLARKELLLLKWNMLQELALELELEWVEACRAHNRLRQLSTAQAQLGGAAVSPPLAGETAGSADPAEPLGGSPLVREGAPPAAHMHHARHAVVPLLQQQLTQQPHLHTQQRQQPQVCAQSHMQHQTQQDQEQAQQEQQQQPPNAAVPDASLQEAPPSQPPAPQQGAPRPPIPAAGQGESSASAVRMETAAHMAGPQGGQEGTAVERSRTAVPHPGSSDGPQPLNPGALHWPAGRQPGTDEERFSGRPPQHSEQQLATSQSQQQFVSERREGDAASGSLPEQGSGSGRGSEQQTRQRDEVRASTARQPTPMPVEQGIPVAPSCQQPPEGAGARGGTAGRVEAPRGGLQHRRGEIAVGPPPRRQPTSMSPGTPGGSPQGGAAEAPSRRAATAPTAGAARVCASQVVGLSHPEPPRAGEHQPAVVSADVYFGASADTGAGAGGNTGGTGGAQPPSHSGRSAAAGAVGQQVVHMPPPADPVDAQRDGRALVTRAGGRDDDQAAAAGAPAAAEHRAATEPPRAAQGGEVRSSRADVERGGAGPGGSVPLGAGPSAVQQQTRAWMPWEDASVAGAGGTGQEAHGNGVATGTGNHDGGDGGSGVTSGGFGGAGCGGTREGDDGREAGSGEGTLFTGLSFKLAAVPMLGGRRVAAMRAQPGPVSGAVASPAPPVRAAALCGVPPAKRAQPSVAALVAAPILRTGRRGSPAVAQGSLAGGGSAAAGAAVADVSAPSRAAAVASPAEPAVRVQSAPQVPPATRARGDGTGNAVAAVGPPAQQALPQPVGSSDSGSAGLREIPAAVARTANQTATHVQAPPAARGTTAATATEESQQQQQQQPTVQGADAPLAARQPSQQQRSAAPPQVAPQRAPSSPLLYRARGDVLLTTQGGAGAAAPAFPSTLQMLGSKYVSPLGIFRLYSGSGTR